MVSGGFDPVHIGHLKLLMAAAERGDVWVALNSDVWLKRKKNYVFMPWEERRAILLAFHMVRDVFPVEDSDGTVAKAILAFRPDFFMNGGDRTTGNALEHAACLRVGCREIFGAGGGKIQSSSELVRRAR